MNTDKCRVESRDVGEEPLKPLPAEEYVLRLPSPHSSCCCCFFVFFLKRAAVFLMKEQNQAILDESRETACREHCLSQIQTINNVCIWI